MGSSINNIKFLGRKFFGVRNLNITPVYDADAQAYFNANTTITSAADKNAINTFYLGLKSDGIYTKIKAMYLPIWGSAASSKWNLVNPLDTNAAYRLSFTTGWSFSSGGITPNGASTFAETFFNPRNNATLYNQHLSYYSRTQTATATNTDIGSFQNAVPNVYVNSIACLRSDGFSVANINANDITRITYSETDARGHFLINRTANNSLKYFKNAVNKGTNTTTTTLINPNLGITIGGLNVDGTVSQYSNKQCAFASIGDGLTDTQVSNFYSRVNTLMTYFGINV